MDSLIPNIITMSFKGGNCMIEIPSYDTFSKVVPINKGMSGDKKYYIETKDNKHQLLRIADIAEYDQKKKEYNRMNKLYAVGTPMPKTIDFGTCNEGKSVYSLLEWIDGQEVEQLIPKEDPHEQYLLGIKSGKNLKLIHCINSKEDIDDWSHRYFAVIDERLDAFYSEGVKFAGYEKIINFLKNNKEHLCNRPQCYLHGDYHMGNMIVNEKDELFIIDWHTVDFDNYGDPWYEFNRIGVEYPDFASGQIDGYFEGSPPQEFWTLLAYYLSASAITSIVWAKYFSPDDLNPILQLNKNILNWYDGMENLIPTWYRNRSNDR